MSLYVLIILSLIWLSAYVTGMINKQKKKDGTRRLPLWSKGAMIAVTLSVACLWIALPHTRLTAAAGWLVAGLVIGALGDLILADVFPLKHTIPPALLAFGVGHGCYIVTLAIEHIQLRLSASGSLLAILLSTALMAILWRALIYNPRISRRFNTGSLIYGIWLFAAVGLSINLTLKSGTLIPFTVGITLFAASDMILAQYLLRKRGKPRLRDIVWLIYSAGQMLIAYSVGELLIP
ncbi:MAG: hypothetical protein JXJ17_12180 [Anaerolineae bacterium]|nr:hypothetical protein [Anaerolineae bacterium]